MKKNDSVTRADNFENDDGGRSSNDIGTASSLIVSGHTPLGAKFLANQSNLSSSRKRLLRKILEESNETFFLSSRELGRRYDVNTATVIRTIQALGYEKFADFSNDLREHFVTQITPYS